MKIGIIGAGSIGMLIGSYLADCGQEVTMLVRKEVQKKILDEEGITCIQEKEKALTVAVDAVTSYEKLVDMQCIIIAVKSQDVHTVLQNLTKQQIQVPLLFIQNGLSHVQTVLLYAFPDVAFATVEHGALKQSDSVVHHNGIGKITFGILRGDAHKFNVFEQVNSKRFPVERHPDAMHILLRKALINCLINPLTTILKIPNGQLVEDDHGHQLMRMLYDELLYAFPEMTKDLPFSVVESICQRTSKNHSSMYADYLAGRRMEIEPIVSAVILKAEKNGKTLPLLRTYEKILLVLDRKAREK